MTIWKNGFPKLLSSPCPPLLLKAMPMAHPPGAEFLCQEILRQICQSDHRGRHRAQSAPGSSEGFRRSRCRSRRLLIGPGRWRSLIRRRWKPLVKQGNRMTILAESFSMLESAWMGWSASNSRNCETEVSSEMASAAQASLELRGGEMHGFSRADILGRYRRYRDLRRDIQTAALESIPHSSFLAHARRIGLSDGKVLFTDDTVELSLAFDLAVYTASAGRTRAIDRCARRRLPASKPDEALVLE